MNSRNKRFGFIVAIFLTTVVIALSHVVVYEAVLTIAAELLPAGLVVVFPHVVSWIVFFALIVLSVSFLAATFISIRWNNAFVRIMYTCAAAWTGIILYLFMGAFIYGVLAFFVNNAWIGWIGAGLLACTFVIASLGFVQANTIRITRARLTIPNIPPIWKNRTFLWVSDVHLGHIRGSHFAKKVARAIASAKPDIICIGGDLYDGVKVDAAAIIEPFRALTDAGRSSHVPLGVYFVMGNHEEFNQADTLRYAEAVKDVGIKILDDEAVSIDGLTFIGVDHGHVETKKSFENVLGNIFKEIHGEKMTVGRNFAAHQPSILLKHEPRDVDVAAAAGISAQISGHTHAGQIFPANLLTKLIFKGFDYGLKNYGNMQVFTSSGVGTWGPPFRVGTRSEIVLFSFSNAEADE